MPSIIAKLRARFLDSPRPDPLPEGHAPVDWSKWSPAGPDDVRSPCPGLNSLANHGFLPHNGKNITKAMVVEAIGVISPDHPLTTIFAASAVASNPDSSAHTFDLNHLSRHGFIEHDVSLSRNDVSLGSNSEFNSEIFAGVMDNYVKTLASNDDSGKEPDIDSLHTDWKTASAVRYARVLDSKARHEKAGKPWTYGIKEAIASYGESSLYLNVLGKDGVVPLRWVKIFFEEQRLPYGEGWRPSPTSLAGPVLARTIYEMVKSGDHGHDEAILTGMGTLEALEASIAGLSLTLLKSPAPLAKPVAI